MSTVTANRPTPSTSTPQTLPSALTPAASGSTPNYRPADSPERANKRARFTAPGAAGSVSYSVNNGAGSGQAPNNALGNSANRTASTPGKPAGTPKTPAASAGAEITPKSTSEDRVAEGMKWVKDKIGEMELVYKETILAAVLITQHKTYCLKIGLGIASVPLHMTRRLERSWARYEALRRHVEYYLLQCAQATATPSKPLTSLPTPLPSLGLTPLPAATPAAALTPNALLYDPNISQTHTAQLEALAQSQGMHSMPGVSAVGAMSSMGGMQGNGILEGMASGAIDFDALLASTAGAGDGGTGDGMDLSSLDELNALLQGGGFDFASLNMPGMGVGGTKEAMDLSAVLPKDAASGVGGIPQSDQPVPQPVQQTPATETSIAPQIPIPTQADLSQPPAPPQSTQTADQTADALLASLQTGDGLGISMTDMDFDVSSFAEFGGADLDIDFEGMFGGQLGDGASAAQGDTSGQAEQTGQVEQQQPPAAVTQTTGQIETQQYSTLPAKGAQVSAQTAGTTSTEINSGPVNAASAQTGSSTIPQPAQPAATLAGETSHVQSLQQQSAPLVQSSTDDTNTNPFNLGFDPNTEDINLDDFDFGGAMPAAEGEEFESIFSEWK